MNKSNLKRIIFCVFILMTVTGLVKSQEKGENKLSLNGIWSFKTDPGDLGEKQKWYSPELSETSWDVMHIPSNWDIKNEYAHYAGKGWYRKTISIPENWKGKTIYLKFEGVYFDSKVWINGKLLGTNDNGFLPFEFEVSKYIHTEANNTIVVAADNFFRVGALWNWGGIRRPVSLVATNAVRIVQQHITPVINLKEGTAAVAVKVFLQNSGDTEQAVQGKVLLHKDNFYTKELTFSALVPANSKKEVLVKTELQKKEVHLWHFDDPFLYDCTTTISNDNKILHQLHKRFGLRKIEVDNKNYTFRLNGESVRLMGFNLVPNDRTTGNTLPLWRIKEDVDMMKELGCNMTRITHCPLPDEMYDYLDERGILVFPEVSLWGNTENVAPDRPLPKEWLKRLIYNNFNHPSVIGWSVGNEIGDNPQVMAYVSSAIKLSKSIDTSHLAVMVSHTAARKIDPVQYSELGLINRYGKNLGPVTDQIHGEHPDKLLFYSEYGVGQLSEDLDGNFDAKAVVNSIRNKPYLMGASLWTFNDYRSNYNGTAEFSENRPWGVVDVFRQKKKAWYAIRKEYAPVRGLSIQEMDAKNGKQASARIIIEPRTQFDLPAYTMSNYRLVWNLKDDLGNIRQSGFENLPVIKPGDKNLVKLIKWNQDRNALSLQVELVSPLNYGVCDTNIFFKKPKAPKIIDIAAARSHLNGNPSKTGLIRVVFDKVNGAAAYKIRYSIDKETKETPATINNYIEINDLAQGSAYKLALIAMNAKGESEPEIRTVTVEYALAAPIIRYTEPAGKGFFVGYSTLADDYGFEVQYTTHSGDYTNAPTLRSTNKGVLFVPGLVDGQKYFYRMRAVKETMFLSLWSAEGTVVPDGGQLPPVPEMTSAVQKMDEAMVLFKPVKKATGYLLNYKPSAAKKWQTVTIDAAQIHQYYIKGLANGKKYDFRLAAVNAFGQSAYSKVISLH